MAAHRNFLLALLATTFMGIVVVQVSLDGWILRGSFQYSVGVKKDREKPLLELPGAKNSTTKIDDHVQILLQYPERKNSTTMIDTHVPTSKSLPTPSAPSLISPNKSTPQLSPPKFHSAPAQRIQARVRVRPPERVIRSGNSDMRNRHLMLISPQARMKEILQQSRSVREMQVAQRFLTSMPIVSPEKVTRVIILTYFRSGSTFLGDILQQNWQTFYHFEPLHMMTHDSRISDDKVPEAFHLFRNLLLCNFTSATKYMEWVKKSNNQFLFTRNLFLELSCKSYDRMCFSPKFVSSICERSPFQIMKVTRLHMRQLKEFLRLNRDLNIKVVYLVRDPRGIISSRWPLNWCNETQCSDPRALCEEMEEDATIFNQLQKESPDNFVQLKYEDLSLHPLEEVKRLFAFLNLPFSAKVKWYLKTHTTARKDDSSNPYSTWRNSSVMPYMWKQKLNFTQVMSIQDSCHYVIHLLNHSLILSPTELEHQKITEIPIRLPPRTRIVGSAHLTKGSLLLSVKDRPSNTSRNTNSSATHAYSENNTVSSNSTKKEIINPTGPTITHVYRTGSSSLNNMRGSVNMNLSLSNLSLLEVTHETSPTKEYSVIR